MGSVLSILAALGPLLSQLTDIVNQAVAASTSNDQATLDALHAKAVALADSLKPAGA
jgi:hypothetical protein